MTRPGGRACTAPTTTAVRGARSLAWRLLSRFQPRIHEWRLVTVAPAEKRKKRKPAFFERTKAITLFGAGRIEAYETEQSAKGCGMRLLSVSVFPFPTGSVVARLREHLCKAERNLPGGSKRLLVLYLCRELLSRAPDRRESGKNQDSIFQERQMSSMCLLTWLRLESFQGRSHWTLFRTRRMGVQSDMFWKPPMCIPIERPVLSSTREPESPSVANCEIPICSANQTVRWP